MPTIKRVDRGNWCIYCRRSGVQLTGEHCVPQGLQGDDVLLNASCLDCAKITSQFEQRCLKEMFRTARAFWGTYGKQRKRERPTTFEVAMSGDIVPFKKRVPIEDYPFAMALPYLDPPSMWTGGKPTDPLPAINEICVAYASDLPDRARRLFQGISADQTQATVTLSVHVLDFYKLLAKIAHVYAAGTVTSGPYIPCLTNFIRGLDESGPYLIGGAFSHNERVESIAEGPALHQRLLFAEPARGNRDLDHLLVRVWIQLFAQARMPVYEVIVGISPYRAQFV